MRRNARRGFDTLFAEDRLSNERRGFVDGGSSCNEAVISIGHEPGHLGLKRGAGVVRRDQFSLILVECVGCGQS